MRYSVLTIASSQNVTTPASLSPWNLTCYHSGLVGHPRPALFCHCHFATTGQLLLRSDYLSLKRKYRLKIIIYSVLLNCGLPMLMYISASAEQFTIIYCEADHQAGVISFVLPADIGPKSSCHFKNLTESLPKITTVYTE